MHHNRPFTSANAVSKWLNKDENREVKVHSICTSGPKYTVFYEATETLSLNAKRAEVLKRTAAHMSTLPESSKAQSSWPVAIQSYTIVPASRLQNRLVSRVAFKDLGHEEIYQFLRDHLTAPSFTIHSPADSFELYGLRTELVEYHPQIAGA